MNSLPSIPPGVTILAEMNRDYAEIVTPQAVEFVAKLHRQFETRRQDLLARRAVRQKEFDSGKLPYFFPETKSIRDSEWAIARQPADLLDRRVEITGPTDRKMVINALNCGAQVFMADFEDANSPTWHNLVDGQINLKGRWAKRIDFTDASTGKAYKLSANPAVLLIRPRGWHLPEDHLHVDGVAMSGSLFDFGLYFFTCAKAAIAAG